MEIVKLTVASVLSVFTIEKSTEAIGKFQERGVVVYVLQPG